MSQEFGPFQNHARVWFDYSQGAVTPASLSVPVSVVAYLQMDGFSSQFGVAGTTYWSGSWGTGNNPQTFTLNPNQSVVIVTWSGSFTLADTPLAVAFGAGSQHYFGYTSHSVGWSIPARWAQTPTALAVTRVSDGQQNLAWNRTSTYSSVVVQRRTDDGPWQEVGRPSGNAFSFSDTSTSANHKYEYRVAGIGGSGQSGWSGTVTIYTTPAPPTSVTAEKVGSNIQVTATGLPPYATAYDIQESTDGGVTWSSLQTGVTSFPFTHVSPSNAVTHTYRVRSTRGALESAYSAASNTVQLLAPPNAPTNLAPNGIAVPTGSITFSWRHNPVDTTAQSAYELRYRLVGAGVWTTLSGTTADSRAITLAANATDYEWQTRTKGQHPDWSPWSAVATVSVISVPGVAITQPGASWGQPVLPVEWSWTQTQGRPQSAWQARLLDAGSNLLEEREGSGAGNSVTFNYRLATGQTYIVQVRAATGNVWSGWATQTFTTLFVPPDDPVVTGDWNEAQGFHSVSADVGTDEDAPAVVSVTVERSIDGGVTWELFAEGSSLPMNLTDPEGLSCGITEYRVTAFAASGASSQTIIEVEAHSQAIYLGGGSNFMVIARLPGDPKVKYSLGRRRSVEEYEGREFAVAYSSRRRLDAVAFGGRIADDEPDWADNEQIEDVVEQLAPVHLYRDMHGKRLYGVISLLELNKVGQRRSCVPGCPAGIWDYTITLTRTGRD